MELIKPKEIEIKDLDDNVHKYTISRFNALDGRKIISQYPIANAPKLGDYQMSENLMRDAFKYVSVEVDGKPIILSTKEIINAYVPDATVQMRLEFALMEYNTNFFGQGGKSGFLNFLLKKALGVLFESFPMLTDSLQSFSQKTQSRTRNSKK